MFLQEEDQRRRGPTSVPESSDEATTHTPPQRVLTKLLGETPVHNHTVDSTTARRDNGRSTDGQGSELDLKSSIARALSRAVVLLLRLRLRLRPRAPTAWGSVAAHPSGYGARTWQKRTGTLSAPLQKRS